jgi:aspartate kinase|tara:strand:+ start:16877 stop:18268 length:1392 start_codon:yes stop_codon:yes gene_type:complete
MKFGGTSLCSADKVRNVSKIVKDYSFNNQIILVASALSGVTNSLVRLSELVKTSNSEKIVNELEKLNELHTNISKNSIKDPNIENEVLESISSTLDELKRLLEGIISLGEITPRSRDRIISFGERLSVLVVTGALKDIGINAEKFTGAEAGIVTDEEYGEANPLMSITKMKISKTLQPLLSKGIVPVVTGFMAATQTGDITTLGRGGSDFTATILGAALSADEVWICTDVNGMMTTDPKIMPNARTIPQLSYSEALEMTVFGAKALHPRALEPAQENKISVRIKNTFNLSGSDTLISNDQSVVRGKVAKSVALIKDVAMVNIEGAGMVGKPGIAAKIFDTFAREGINILMISQSVSEANISLIIRRKHLEKAVNTLEISLLGRGFANRVNAEDDVGVIAVVGAGMQGSQGVAARVFNAVAKKGINIRMIAQGSSELNISIVIKEKNCENAVKAIHEEFEMGTP